MVQSVVFGGAVGVGRDVDEDMLTQIVTGDPEENGAMKSYDFADNTPDPNNGGHPKYVA